jgi:hypothetical protein
MKKIFYEENMRKGPVKKMRSPLQRKASKLNGSRSQGPKAPETKAISAQNALRHGLTARKLSLPDEDPVERQERATQIAEELNPQTALQNHLVHCINSAINRQLRCERASHGKLTRQLHAARSRSDPKARRALENAQYLFKKGCPLRAILLLRRTAAGCRWLKELWSAMRDRLRRYGILSEPDLDFLLRLFGEGPGRLINTQVCEIVYLAMGTWPTPAPFGMISLKQFPAVLLQQYRSQWPTPQAHAEELLRRIDARIAELDTRIVALEVEEEIQREGRAAEAMVIEDLHEAELRNRYAKDADTTLFRTLKEYWALKEQEAALAAEDHEEDQEASDDAASVVPDASPPAPVSAETGVAGTEAASEPPTAAPSVPSVSPEALQILKDVPLGLLREAAAQAVRASQPNEPGAPACNPDTLEVSASYADISGIHSAITAGLGDAASGEEVSVAPMPPPDRPPQH